MWKVFSGLLALFVAGFLWFVMAYQAWVEEESVVRLSEDARVIADSLWRYEDPPLAYLELASRSNHYKAVQVYDEVGKVYAQVSGPGPGPLDGVLTRAGLLPVRQMEDSIQYRGRVIGSIVVQWQNRSVFVYFYLLVCMVLLFLGIWFLFRLFIAGKTLKIRVQERTADLKESQDRLQAILDNAEAVIFLKDNQGRYVTVNRRFETLFKIDRSDIVGLRDHDIFPKDIAEGFLENDAKVLEARSAMQFEESVPEPDGTQRDYISVKFPLKKVDGSIYALCGISTDITKMKLVELERRRLRNYLFNIIDSMPSVLIGVDARGRITLWNRRAEEMTGTTVREVLGRPLEEVYPALGNRMETVQKAIRTGMVQEHKKQAESDPGKIGYEDITVFPLAGEGAEGAVIRVDDVTDQVRLEEMMIQSEKMLSVGGLAAGMAHEINNPLAGIMQTANVLALRLQNIDMPANQKAAREIGVPLDHIRAFMEKRGILEMLAAINASGVRVAEIVNNMLSFARKSNAAVSSHDPAALMDRILDLAATDYDLKKQYDFKSINIIKEYEPGLPALPCEGAKIQQVILNILRNGAQAMVAGKVDTPCFILRISTEKGAGMLRIEIQDNGPGMERAVRKRIFEPFFTTKPVGVGTGLGLSVSYFIVTENHGGTMGVSSAPGKGSTFIIRLPLNGRRSGQFRQGEEAGYDG